MSKLNDILSPFTAWKHLINQPVTIKDPVNRIATDRYRGFHKNDLQACIGCGTCEAICQNAAIDLVPVEGIETKNGDSGLRPRIDYGRCCWCALCVDICTTNSLTLSNEYIWVDNDPEVFRFVPGAENKPWDGREKGWHKPDSGYELYDPERVSMGELHPHERDHSFIEIVQGYSREQAQLEADRCVSCGICVATCSAHMGIPAYITAVRNNDLEEGLRILYETNPLPEICGRICTHKCEEVCSVGHHGDPLSIRWLKRYIADQIPGSEYKRILEQGEITPNGKKVAIIGAGPSGLSAAYYLALMGYHCMVFEKFPEPGGMMRYGIPEYRLPYDQLDKDIDYIRSLGVEIRCNTTVGKEITLEQLQEQFDAVYTGTGLHDGRSTRIPGTDHAEVYQAADLLRDITLGKEVPVAEQIVVIGGGNVAMDITRSMARLQKQKYGMVDVTATSLESEEEMPADREEVVEAREEGARVIPGWGPVEIEIRDGKITGLHVVKCTSVFDENRRFNPTFDESVKEFFPAVMVIESIGQGMDLSYIPARLREEMKMDRRGRIEVNRWFQTSLPWLFAGGDIIQGPDVIHGIANGHTAAEGIDRYLTGNHKKNM
ncbi:MAG: FAD-dependent oxidoreductase [Bacteroidales bacterium]|nr:FAD-dependent oxidoreductase [Bacteroidales bacterium]